MSKKEKEAKNLNREIILSNHEADELLRPDGEKLWDQLWHATIPVEFIVVATQEKFNGSVWAVYAYITTRINLETGKSRRLKPDTICEALGICASTLDRAKATLKEYGFLSEDSGEGSVYHLQDIQVANKRAKERKIAKQREAKIAKHEAFIADQEKKLGHKLSIAKRTELIKQEYNEKYLNIRI